MVVRSYEAREPVALGGRGRQATYPSEVGQATNKGGRGSRIRTCDLLVPNQTRYQTALCPDGNRRSIHASIQAGKQAAFSGR